MHGDLQYAQAETSSTATHFNIVRVSLSVRDSRSEPLLDQQRRGDTTATVLDMSTTG